MRDLLEIYEHRTAIGTRHPQAAAVQSILEELTEKLVFERAFLVSIEPVTGAIRGIASVNVPDDFYEAFQGAPRHRMGVLVSALEQGRHLIVQDALRDERVAEDVRPYYVRWDMHCFAAVPLLPVSCVLAV